MKQKVWKTPLSLFLCCKQQTSVINCQGLSYLVLSCESYQVPDLLHVAAALKDVAALAGDSSPTSSSSSSSSYSRRMKRQQISEIWTSIYNAASSPQASVSVVALLSAASTLNMTFVLFGNTDKLIHIQSRRGRQHRPDRSKVSK